MTFPPTDLVTHPGRRRRQLYLDTSLLSLLRGRDRAWRAAWARHEWAHIEHPDEDEVAIQARAPLPPGIAVERRTDASTAIQTALRTLEGRLTRERLAEAAGVHVATLYAHDYRNLITAENTRRQQEQPERALLEAPTERTSARQKPPAKGGPGGPAAPPATAPVSGATVSSNGSTQSAAPAILMPTGATSEVEGFLSGDISTEMGSVTRGAEELLHTLDSVRRSP